MRFSSLPLIITRVITLLIAFTVHEFAHAVTADRLGDKTPRREGRLSLNPLRHLDFWGCVMLICSGFGWARPVRVNSKAVTRKHRFGMVWVALAGPLSNFLMALTAALVYRFFPSLHSLPARSAILPTPYYFLNQFIWTNLNLMVFNLIPLSPLDGSRVADELIPKGKFGIWDVIQNNGRRILVLLLFILPRFNIDPLGNWVSKTTGGLYLFLTHL